MGEDEVREMQDGDAEVVFFGGTVMTMDARGYEATAVAVRDGKILFVGSDAEVLKLAGPSTRVVDLNGRFMCPGFHDSHNHMLSTGLGLLLPSLARCGTIDELLSTIGEQARTAGDAEWVVTAADWHESALREGRMPTIAELDAVSHGHPLVLRRGGHNVVLNSKALEKFHLSDASEAPADANFVRSNGRLTGQIVGSSYVSNLLNELPKPSLDQYREALKQVQQHYAAAGITAVIDPGLSLGEMEVYRTLDAEGALKVRVSMMWKVPSPGFSVQRAVEQLDSGVVQVDRDGIWLRTIGVKVVVDGGVETGYYREPYLRQDDPEHPCGKPFQSAEDLQLICCAANRAGLPVGAHCVGDAGIDLALDAFEAADRERPIGNDRWSLIHMLYPRDDHWTRLNALGVGVAAQQPLHYALGGGFAEYLGRDRAGDISPLAQFLARCGTAVGGGSDSPVAPFEPLSGISSSVTRETRSAGILGPQWSVSVTEALAMYTSGSAWVAFDEHRTGRIAAGMLADLVVLSADPRKAGAEEIADIEILATMAAGRLTHGDLDNQLVPAAAL